jgi:hypothetical protein
MPEEKDKPPRQCIVKLKNYEGNYYDGNAGYMDNFLKAKIYNENEVPGYIKDNPNDETIFLDTKRGLELLAKEYKRLQDYVDLYESRVNDAKEGMKKLLGFDSVKKYIDLHNKWYHPLIGISQETKNKIIEDIVAGKE